MVNSVATSLKGLNVLTVQRLSKTCLPGNAANSALASSRSLGQPLFAVLICCSCSCLKDLHARNLSATEHHWSNPELSVILLMRSFDSNNSLFLYCF